MLVRDVKAGSSYLSQSDTRVHIGLDRAAAAERLEVHWPAGATEVFNNGGGQSDPHHSRGRRHRRADAAEPSLIRYDGPANGDAISFRLLFENAGHRRATF